MNSGVNAVCGHGLHRFIAEHTGSLQYSCRSLFGSESAVLVPAGPIERCSCVGRRGAGNTS